MDYTEIFTTPMRANGSMVIRAGILLIWLGFAMRFVRMILFGLHAMMGW